MKKIKVLPQSVYMHPSLLSIYRVVREFVVIVHGSKGSEEVICKGCLRGKFQAARWFTQTSDVCIAKNTVVIHVYMKYKYIIKYFGIDTFAVTIVYKISGLGSASTCTCTQVLQIHLSTWTCTQVYF